MDTFQLFVKKLNLIREIDQGGKDEKGGLGKDGAGPSPITAQLMFQAMTSMSPGGVSSGSANREHAKDQNDHQLLTRDHDKKHQETDNG